MCGIGIKVHCYFTLFLGQLLFVPHLIFSDLWPRGVLLVLWQKRLVPLRGHTHYHSVVLTDLTKDLSKSNIYSSLQTKWTIPGSKQTLCNEGNEGKVLPAADSSFSRGKTDKKEKVAEVRGRKGTEAETQRWTERGRLTVLPSPLRGPRSVGSKRASQSWTFSALDGLSSVLTHTHTHHQRTVLPSHTNAAFKQEHTHKYMLGDKRRCSPIYRWSVGHTHCVSVQQQVVEDSGLSWGHLITVLFIR